MQAVASAPYRKKLSGEAAFASELAFAIALERCKHIVEVVKKADVDIRPGSSEVPAKLASITNGQLEVCKELILSGVSAQVAACKAFRIHPLTFNSWMEQGAKPQGPLVHRDFFLAIRDAVFMARAVAESRVFIENPEGWLMRGPGGRSLPGEPGWSDERLVKHSDETGDGPVRVRLEFTPRGARVLPAAKPEEDE